ncbi:MAG: diguanylate cyclase [Gammaproteobacteria bacterium]|nr:diguanylate cyclase [Gammaproteobacteria bacterium]MBU1656000.1 diguanylate cyclase [Gammaproteobacteria bacterium]MBU1962208.1 diguanylate cyclase [Gammaproteobacteria bacterium]
MSANTNPNEALSRLLHTQKWPNRLVDSIRQLQERLQADMANPGAWTSVLEEIVLLLLSAFGGAESDLKETKTFLVTLDNRLKEIDSVINHIQTIRDDAMESNRDLQESLGMKMGRVHRDGLAATDLDAFREVVGQHLNSIQARIEQHLQGERDRIQEEARNTERMRDQMRSLEDEEQKLRGKLAEALILATTDRVTGLPNRTAYDRRIREEHLRWKRFRRPLCLVVWDVDDFKTINDIYGHRTGDEVLGFIGRIFLGRLRETDFVARYGGEEFVMLLPGASLEQASRVAEEIRRGVSDRPFNAGMKRVPVTISCGVCEFRNGDSSDSVFGRAERALYQAKQAGKNRSVVDQGFQ